jgi:hypothetical protein
MSIQNFPNGIASFGVPVLGGVNIPVTTGNYWFVDSAHGSDGNTGKTPKKAFKTYDYAIGKCTANHGDVIVLCPKHAENISTASGITNDVAGVTTVGLGYGGLKPKFSFTAATATHVISAANNTFINVQWEANYLDVAIGLDVSAVDGTTFESCWFTDAASNLNFIITIDLADGASNLTVRNCKFLGTDAQNDTFINGVAHSGIFIYDSFFCMQIAQAAAVGLIATSSHATNVEIKRCSFVSNVDGAIFIDFSGSTCSGVIAECYFSSADTAGAVGTFDFTGGHMFECYVAGEADTFGLVGGGSGTVYNNA